MQLTSFYIKEELSQIGFKTFGENVLISRFARFYHPERISIGSNVRIDDYCIFSAGGNITLGNYIHIAPYTSFIGEGDILVEDFCSISGRVSIYSSSDDYMGLAMTNPMIPQKYRRVQNQPVILRKHTIIGCDTVILPGVEFGEGASIGAKSLVKENCESETIYTGNPLKEVGKRYQRYHKFENKFIEEIKLNNYERENNRDYQ